MREGGGGGGLLHLFTWIHELLERHFSIAIFINDVKHQFAPWVSAKEQQYEKLAIREQKKRG
jgi:hypothetical protein